MRLFPLLRCYYAIDGELLCRSTIPRKYAKALWRERADLAKQILNWMREGTNRS